MSRPPRIEIPGYPLHVWVRGNNRGTVFAGDAERHVFLKALEKACEAYECDLHAYVLMTNHFHLLVTGRVEWAISRMVQDIGRRFVRFVNKYRDRTGTLFEGRFKSNLVETDSYLLTCMKYIELNPVRASMVSHPGRYPWSSFAANGSGRPGPPLVPHPTYLALGSTAMSRAEAYLRLVDQPLTDAELEAIRKSLREGRALGSAAFTAWAEGTDSEPVGSEQ